MRYAQHRSNYKAPKPEGGEKRSRTKIVTGFVIILVIITLVSVFNKSKESESVPPEETVQKMDKLKILAPIEDNNGEIEEVQLLDISKTGAKGFARRETLDELFTHVIVAELPSIDLASHYYEGWLVKPGISEFFSTGEMFPRADGKFGLVWEKNVSEVTYDLDDYAKIVITLELRDGNNAPSPDHIMEGEFSWGQ